MYLFYIDESGNTGADFGNVDQPIHWLVGLGVKPGVLRSIETEMLALALKHFPQRARKPEFEFHGSHIFGRRGDCKGWSGEAAVALFAEVVGVLARYPCSLFIAGIDKPELARRTPRGALTEHPSRIAFMYLVERIDQWLGELQPVADALHGDAEPEYGLLVADEQQEVERQIIEGFAHSRDVGTDHDRGGHEIRYLIDTVHFVTSQDSWIIQLVDCVAYLFQRYVKVKRLKGDDRARYTAAEVAVVRLWEECCEERVARFYLWPAP